MKRWVIGKFGRDNLRMEETARPRPGTGEVLVRVSAVSLNPRDLMMIDNGMGVSIDFPFVPASDMAGVVEAVGEGVEQFAASDRVISNFMPEWADGLPTGSAAVPSYRTLGGYFPGMLSEYVCGPQTWFTKAPVTLDDAEASTLPVAGLVAWFSLIEQGHLKAGDTVLIPGTGGVGIFGLQLAVAHGAEVIITSSSEEKLRRAKALGAAHGINRNADIVKEVLALTGGRGANHVLELVGGDNLARSVAAAAVGGRISLIGLQAGMDVHSPTTPILLKGLVLQGMVTGHRRALADFVRAVDRIRLKPVIDRRHSLNDVPAALEQLARGPFGKVVVDFSA